MSDLHNKAFATRAVHAGERGPRPDYTPVVAPIHPTVGFVYGSPTVAAFEAAIADLEQALAAMP